MAVTFAATDLRKDVFGNKRAVQGLLTLTGTTTDNGDALSANAVGLSVIERIDFDPFLDSTSNPENAVAARYIPSTGKVVFFGGAAAGSAQAAVTDSTDLSNYAARFTAYGK